MTVTVIVGAQWGDEGKGRVVDYLAERADMVIRFQGGDNAGHTVVNARGRFALHLVPSGIFHPGAYCLLGPGTVVNLDALGDELAALHRAGVDARNLHIDYRAHLLLPWHRLLDGAAENWRKRDCQDDGGAEGEMGTTRRGIGPAYADKYSYKGVRVGDLRTPDVLRQRLEALLPARNAQLAFYGLKAFTLDELTDLAAGWRERFGHLIVDSLPAVRAAVEGGRNVLLEGQLGVGRCVDWGIYPYVTGSSPTAGGACVGAGIPPRAIDEVLGVVKAYSTSVGGGPFPTELNDEAGDMLQEIGSEFGATTGRVRRCGWFDGVAIRQAAWLNGFTSIAVTKLDVLDSFPAISICTGYRLGNEVLRDVPDTATQGLVTPIYESWAGWLTDTSGCRTWEDLPSNARAYLRRIEALAGAPIRYVSVGPERSQMVIV
ncbi:MAG TPA: adenylosuccinate synthase [Armatimonadota bacterium]|nr:adenylosuccinate synthase [Armatimonadota bacterium]